MMTTTRWIIPLVLSVLVPCVVDADDRVETWLARHIEAIGGLESLEALHSLRATGTYSTSADEQPAPFVQAWVAPDKLLFESPGRERMGTDGQVNWLFDAEHQMAVELPMVQATRYLRLASAGGPLMAAYRQGFDLRAGGVENRGGVETQVLEVEYPNGDRGRFYLHPETSLLVEADEVWQIAGNEAVITMRYEDYRSVAGVQMPFATEQETTQGWRRFAFEELEPNVEMAPDNFQKP